MDVLPFGLVRMIVRGGVRRGRIVREVRMSKEGRVKHAFFNSDAGLFMVHAHARFLPTFCNEGGYLCTCARSVLGGVATEGIELN